MAQVAPPIEATIGPAPLIFTGRSSLTPSSRTSSSIESPKTASSTMSFVEFLTPDSCDEVVVPKLESDDDHEMIDSKILDEYSSTENSPASEVLHERRPRGRPRKHPREPFQSLTKAPKGRSKTGCLTCRRRKKKCDEGKPTCQHCEKNNVICEGYQPKGMWRSGRLKIFVKGKRLSLTRPRPLPILIEGIENDLDWQIFDHFNQRLSTVLSVRRDKHNPFQDILLPLATSHGGLMHSLLALSGAHLVLKNSDDKIEQRRLYHIERALHTARESLGNSQGRVGDEAVLQILLLFLETICNGSTRGEYQCHLDAAKRLLLDQPPENPEVRAFVSEFLLFHDVANSLTSERTSLLMNTSIDLPEFIPPESEVLMGVRDGLFESIAKIRLLRDRIRLRRANGEKPDVDFATIVDGKEIDRELNDRKCPHTPDTPQWICWQLYRTCIWLYLHRTIKPSTPNLQLREGVAEALTYLRAIPPDCGVQSVLLTPIFMLGCSAFYAEQRPEILEAFDVLQDFSGLGNIQVARDIVENMWNLMDRRDERTWDWERVMKEMGFDILIT